MTNTTNIKPFSIVIPTHNRPQRLLHLLLSIQTQRPPGLDEVVVVDDSESPLDLDEEFPALKLKHVILGKRAFMSASKNIGWRAASADCIYFIDDDNVVGEASFAPLLKALNEDPSLGAVMPGVVYHRDQDLVWVYATPFQDSRHRLNLVGRNMPRNPDLESRQLKTDALPNASLVRREALEQVQGFDEQLVVNSSLDFAQRLKMKGWQVRSCPRALIQHDVELPGRLGWWASHGSADPERVRYELRDWFLMSKRIHSTAIFFRPTYAAESLKFVLPNLLAYMTRGGMRWNLIRSVAVGYVEGLRLAGAPQKSYFLRKT